MTQDQVNPAPPTPQGGHDQGSQATLASHTIETFFVAHCAGCPEPIAFDPLYYGHNSWGHEPYGLPEERGHAARPKPETIQEMIRDA